MAKNILSRLQLKYDSYVNWTDSSVEGKGANLKLLAGEVGICYIPSGTSASGVQNPPHVMFKVGDGEKTFAELPWTSAKAADVYTWAKQANLPVAVGVNNGNVVSNIYWDSASNGIKYDTVSVATSDELSKLDARVEDLEAIDHDLYATNEALENAVNAINTAIDLKLDKSVFESFKTENTSAIATAKSEAIADAADQVKALKEGEVANNTAAINAIKDHASVDSFADVMAEMAKYQIAGDYATKAEAQGYADAKDEAIAEAKKAGTDAAAALEVYKTSNDAAVALKANQSALEAEIARAKAAEEANADEIARVNTVLVNAIENEDGTALNSIKELAAWIEEHGTEASEMAASINANAADIEVLQGEMDNVEGRADSLENRMTSVEADIADIKDGDIVVGHAAIADKIGDIAAADVATKAYADQAETDAIASAKSYTDEKIAAEVTARDAAIEDAIEDLRDNIVVDNADHANSADVASSLNDAGIAQVQAIKVNNAAHADDADKLGGVAADQYALKTDAQGYANTAESNAKAYAKEYADGLASNYATAAQGEKADSALQSITVGEGLTITDKANNSQEINIAEDVIFVLNCGTASTVI